MLNNPKDKKLPEGVPPLVTYYMYLTGGCNLACRHCWISPTYQANGGTGGHLDFDLYKLAIEEALPLGLKSIKFTGGEPLLHPDFVSMVDYATEKGLTTWMETNGTLVIPALAHHLKKDSSLEFISVSMDGSTATSHDYMRNVKGSFERAQQGVFYLIEAGYQPQLIMSIYPGNINEIESLVRWAEKVGCSSVKFNLLQPSGRGELMKVRGEWLDITQMIDLGQFIERKLQQTVSIPLLYSWPMAFHGVKRLLRNQGEICDIEHILGVLSTGHLAMCGIGIQETELVYGQLGLTPVRDVWTNSLALAALRGDFNKRLEGICSHCIHQKRCKGNCLAQNYFVSKRLNSSFWFCEMADQDNLFPAERKC